MKVSQNNDIIQLTPNLVVQNTKSYEDTNVVVTFTIPTGLKYVSSTPDQGTYNATTKKWTVGTLAGKSSSALKSFKLRVTNIDLAPFTVNALVAGSAVDPNPGNNGISWVIEADTCAPSAGTTSGISSCLCGTVSKETTICDKGVTEWRLDTNSITNGVMKSWDITTGNYNLQYIDPTKDITFKYSLFCVQGVDNYLIASGVNYTVRAGFAKSSINHTISNLRTDQMTAGDIEVLQLQHPSIDVSEYCWNVIKNQDGFVTSGVALDCEKISCTKTTFQNIVINFVPATPQVGIVFPEDPNAGDIHIVTYANGTMYLTYSGLNWGRVFREDIAPTELTVTGTSPNKVLNLRLSNGQILTTNLGI